MPAHDEWLTLLLAGCFLLALNAGFTSLQTAHAWLTRNLRPAANR